MYTMDKDVVLHVRIKNADKDFFFKKAAELGCSVSDVVRYLLQEYRRKEHGNVKTCEHH